MTDHADALLVEEPVIRALLDRSAAKNWGNRSVLAVLAVPRWDGDREIRHADRTYRIWPCSSVLAVRDALRHRDSPTPPIILTNLDRDQLGIGICDHLVDFKPLVPDLTVALRDVFSASRQESRLLRHRDSAVAVLRQLNGGRIPPAPGGVLTQSLLLGTVIKNGFGLDDQAPTATDLLTFSADRAAADRFADWRQRSGDALAADVLEWLQGNLDRAAAPIIAALEAGRMGELLPIGLVAGLLYPDGPDSAAMGSGDAELELKIELGHYLQLTERQPDVVWTAFAQASLTAVSRLSARRDSILTAVFDQADRLATGPLHAGSLIERSDFLPSALVERVRRLARAGSTAAAIEPLAPADLQPVEALWVRAAEHYQARSEHPPSLLTVSLAAVRLLRYLAAQSNPVADVRHLPTRYLDHESWVDTAVNDAASGSSDRDVADLVNQVVTKVRARRSEQDRQAAALLPALTHIDPVGPLYIEQILDRVVAPIARGVPVLLLVLDGMSAAAAHDVVNSVGRIPAAAWQEAELTGSGDGLRAAVAVFPTVTERSRCSLLSAGLALGPDRTENTNFKGWLRSNGFQGSPSGAALFHKADLDAQAAGYDLPSAVRAAIDDTAHRSVVAVVLNTIDDALDRSDPLRTEWGIGNVRHLEHLLAAAARVGRTVVLTSDHGHVVERRELGIDRRSSEKPARWRPAGGQPAGVDEIELSGPRVLTEGNRVILAVDEQLRYGQLRAGYHGGGALAELVVPVTILVSGEIAEGSPLRLAPPRAPDWWQQSTAVVPVAVSIEPERPESPRRRRPSIEPISDDALFTVPAIPDSTPPAESSTEIRLAKLLRSKQFQTNRDRFGGSLSPAQVGALFEALVRAGGSITVTAAAAALEVPAKRAPRVLAVVSQIVNIDGVPVLTQDSTQVLLAIDLLFEQFGVGR